MNINFQSPLPLFIQVAQQIEQSILNGVYTEGTQIPSTTEISTTYQINPATVLKGMNRLVDDGILEKRRGVGVFVAQNALTLLQQKQQHIFLNDTLPHLLSTAKLLNITKEQFIHIIERSYDS